MSGGNGAVLILGGGLMQLPAIREARALGLERHMADGNDRCRGRDDVERFYHVDLRDHEGLLATARQIPNLRGVFTAGTDFSASVAYVAEKLGLPGIDFTTARRATDKGLMRETLSAAGIRVPRFIVFAGDEPDSRRPVVPFPPPYIVKPVDNMGARGVRRVDSADELVPVIRKAQALSATGKAIVEERITGTEYSLDALATRERVWITGVAERHIFFPPFFVELGHTMPANLSERDRTALETTFTAAIRALGIADGAAKGDIFLDHDDSGEPVVTVGEVAARLSGGFMSGWTFPYASGIPLTQLGLRIAVGDPPVNGELLPRRRHIAVERALISGPGIVKRVETPSLHRNNGDFNIDLFVHCAPDERVAPPTNNVEKVANVIVAGNDRAAVEEQALDILDAVVVSLQTGVAESDRFFFESGWSERYSRYRHTDSERTSSPLRRRLDLRRWKDTVRKTVHTGKPIPVHSTESIVGGGGSVSQNQPTIAFELLLQRLESERGIVFDDHSDVETSIIFYRSILAAGRQGFRYFRDTVMEQSGRMERIDG